MVGRARSQGLLGQHVVGHRDLRGEAQGQQVVIAVRDGPDTEAAGTLPEVAATHRPAVREGRFEQADEDLSGKTFGRPDLAGDRALPRLAGGGLRAGGEHPQMVGQPAELEGAIPT
jgi:hypothetical protein